MKRKVTIKKMGDCLVVDYRDLTNKRFRFKFTSLKEAKEHKAKIEAELAGTVIVREPREERPLRSISVKDAIKNYRSTSGRSELEHYKRTDVWHFELFFEFMCVKNDFQLLHEIGPLELDRFSAYLHEKKYAGSTINRVNATLKPFFKKCVQWGFLAKSPTDGLKKKAEGVVQVRAWSPEIKNQVRERLHPRALEFFYFCAVTGSRPIDANRTNWGDIDFERRLIRFRNFKGGNVSETHSPMPDDLHDRLMTLYAPLKRAFKTRETDPVFLNIKGNRWTTNAISKHIRLALRGCGIKGKSLYGLRHSFVSELVDLGIHPRDIQELARHKKFETTLRYAKCDVEHIRSVGNRLAEAQKKAQEA